MNRQDAAIIFKFKQEGPAQRGLHQRAVVIGSVVVSDSGVIAPNGKIQPVAGVVNQHQALRLNTEFVSLFVGLDDCLGKKTYLVTQL